MLNISVVRERWTDLAKQIDEFLQIIAVKAGKIRFISKYAGMHRIERKSEIENSWERIYLAVGSMICLRDVMGEYQADFGAGAACNRSFETNVSIGC